ncbi:MAG: response regulator transcription factor, partial [Eubacterium sp.]|nr:response regulator transcription factor [Eubacterium sp.]
YITKPFDTKELLARISVQLRKSKFNAENEKLSFDDVLLDTASHLVSVSEQEIRLTRTEYAILKLLMKNPNQVIAKSVLLERISEDTPDCTESSLKIHISNLRKKLREINQKDYIESVWGIGFKMKS